MFKKIYSSLKNINIKLYLALLVFGFVPTIYTTVRVFLIGQLPSEWSFSIAGQLSWVSLLYEIANEAVILPLFYFMGNAIKDKKIFSNRIRTGLIVSLGVYGILSLFTFIFAESLLKFMAVDSTIFLESLSYIRIECIANIFALLFQFMLIVLVSINKEKYLYLLTGVRLILGILVDVLLVSNLPISLKLGINGIGYSNIIVNCVLLITTIFVLYKENIRLFMMGKLDFSWMKEFAKVGMISGIESFVRNIAYMVMIARMVNMVSEQGTYWVANSFVWGWLLLPVIQLGELIKQEVSADKSNVRRNFDGYIFITSIISVLWFSSIPIWKPFMTHVLGFTNVNKLFDLVLLLVGFYVLYAFQNIFDSVFYGLGKTHYMLFESVVTNAIYYGCAFILYVTGVWLPSLTSIALLFGIGNAFDSLVSFVAYRYMLHKEKF